MWCLVPIIMQLQGCASLFMKDPNETAQEWGGVNASVLLAKWGNPPTAPFKNGDEIGYYWRFGTDGGYQDDTHQEVRGVDASGAPVMSLEGGQYYAGPQTYCEVTFYTNHAGTITRYVMQGVSLQSCARYVNGWGGPNKTSLF